jgi:hypothetical protein
VVTGWSGDGRLTTHFRILVPQIVWVSLLVSLGSVFYWPNSGFLHLTATTIAFDHVNSICFEILFVFQV